MFLVIIIALVTYTCMIVSNKLRKPVAISGTVIMIVYCIIGSAFPLDKLFEKFPIKISILVFIPCTLYLIGLAIYTPIASRHHGPPPKHRLSPPPPPLPPLKYHEPPPGPLPKERPLSPHLRKKSEDKYNH